MKISKKIGKLVAVMLAMLCFSLSGLDVENADTTAILVSVDGEAITLGDVLRESGALEEAAVRAYQGKELSEELEKSRRASVERLIDRKLQVREFQRLNMTLPEQYVENLMDELAENFGCKTRSELARKARSAGISLDDLRQKASERIMADMVVSREFYAAGEPTPREIYEYFEAHKAEFSQPVKINLALLKLPLNTENGIIEDIAKKLAAEPGRFAEFVKIFSGEKNKDSESGLGLLELSALRPEFAEALPTDFIKSVGKVQGPVRCPEAVYFLKVLDYVPGKAADLKDSENLIRQKLLDVRRNQALQQLSARLRKNVEIRYYFTKDKAETEKFVAEAEGKEKTDAPQIPELQPPPNPEAKQTSEQKPVASAVISQPKTNPVKQTPVKPVKPMEKRVMVTLKTNFGDIKLEMYPEAAPKTVANFLEYVRSGFYNGTLFHRVIDGFMIQGGGFDQKFRQKATREPITNEADNGLSNEIGTIAMARTSDPHSATAQFFINVANNDFLDFRSPSPQFYGYCVFGKVVEGMDVVNKIKLVKTGGRGGHQDVPKEDVVILEALVEE